MVESCLADEEKPSTSADWEVEGRERKGEKIHLKGFDSSVRFLERGEEEERERGAGGEREGEGGVWGWWISSDTLAELLCGVLVTLAFSLREDEWIAAAAAATVGVDSDDDGPLECCSVVLIEDFKVAIWTMAEPLISFLISLEDLVANWRNLTMGRRWSFLGVMILMTWVSFRYSNHMSSGAAPLVFEV
jgi:hypothetical protein